MSETPTPRQGAAALAPVAHPRWRLPRSAGWLALIGVLGLKFAVCREPEPDCATVARTGNDAQIILACGREYVRTGDPATGATLADAHRLAGNLPVARAIANALMLTPVRGDALRVLGQIAKAERRYDDALAAFDKARARHRAIADHEGLARDDQAIASVQSIRANHPAALRALDECITESTAAQHMTLAAYCHLSAARVMTQSGAYDSARNEYDRAQQIFRTAAQREQSDRDLAWLDFERGKLEQEARRAPRTPRRFQLERQSFESAIERAHRVSLPRVASAAELNLAWSLADAGALDDAERHLGIADELDDKDAADSRRELHAELAYHRGRLDDATAIYDAIYDQLEPDDQLDVAVMQTRIALARADYPRAEQWARRGIDGARKIRLAQPAIELRQWALSNRRLPDELRFVALARAGRLDEAMATLEQWQGQAALDALSRPTPAEPPDLRGVATRIDQLRSWLPAIGGAPRLQRQPDPAHRIADVARGHDLLGLIVADDRLWRITSGHGQLAITELGAMAGFEDDLRLLRDHPTDAEVAARLGARLVPDAQLRPSADSLRVVLDAALDGLPVAALRVHGQPVIAARSIIYATSVSRLACQPPAQRPRPVVILGDAGRDLPAAAAEARALGHLLHVDPALGPAATAAALSAAGPGSLLHVAVHGDIDASGGFLALADRRLHALELLDRQHAPELVVLSACVSALSSGLELADSLAAAFLAAGATQVVATLHTVPDAAARDVMARFYAAGGADDPARALARVQRTLADAGDPTWPSFAVFGQDLCVDGEGQRGSSINKARDGNPARSGSTAIHP